MLLHSLIDSSSTVNTKSTFLYCTRNILKFKDIDDLWLALPYLHSLLHTQTSERPLRSTSTMLLTVPRTRLVSAGGRACQKTAPVLWNKLPVHIRLTNSLEAFRRTIENLTIRKGPCCC